MSRRKAVILLLSVFTICAALLVSTSGKPGSPIAPLGGGAPSSQLPQVANGDDREPITLTIAVSMDETEFQYWIKSNERYLQGHPRVTVNLTNIRDEDPDAARKQASETGEPFDIMLLDNDRVRELAMRGDLLPVDEIVTGDFAADQLEALTDMVKWNGSLWGVPVDGNPLLNVWSKPLLKAGGAAGPPKDMAAFKTLTATLAASKPGVSPFNLNSADARALSAWLGLFQEDAKPAANLSPFTAAQKEQLRFAAGHAKELTRYDPLLQGSELVQAFREDKLLSAVIPWTVYFRFSDAERSLLSIGSANGPVVRSNGRSFVLTAETDKLADAREWIRAMTEPEAQLARYRAFGRLPARASVMTGEFEFNEIANRPPHYLVPMLQTAAAAPDPPWRERWERWSALCASLGGNARPFTPEAAERLIAEWNGERPAGTTKSGAEAPPTTSL
ncbi:extracellular solute-binding protein [Paenibacillus sp. MWE-103]|uniref:Extracellular solute-binding protein n=1 Tax=Paenibacillus artemisiicola TaxID=1172618 RepID=A0ABS3W6P9_9BACL|nr:extracellular solute-binding protein [Paenibacillus artemisiicola]